MRGIKREKSRHVCTAALCEHFPVLRCETKTIVLVGERHRNGKPRSEWGQATTKYKYSKTSAGPGHLFAFALRGVRKSQKVLSARNTFLPVFRSRLKSRKMQIWQ